MDNTEKQDLQVIAPAAVEEDEQGQEAATEKTCPKDYYFKGFLSWCLWGYVPIEESGEGMKSNLFSDSKSSTSFGRNTGSRAALKKAARAMEDGMLPTLDERRGTKKQRLIDVRRASSSVSSGETRDNIIDGKNAAGTTLSITASVLSQTLAFMDSEAMEKQLQKKNALQARIVRDELASTIRMSDKLWQRYEHMKDPGMLARLHKCDADVAELELLLKVLQNTEVVRRTEAIATRASSSLVPTIPLQECPATAPRLPAKIVVLPTRNVPGSFETPIAQRQPAVPLIVTNAGSPIPCLCIDCLVTTTSHHCRRCKEFVCDLCCFTDRDLEMVWWCRNCFDNESLTTQTIIRAGNYDSDGEDVNSNPGDDDDNEPSNVN